MLLRSSWLQLSQFNLQSAAALSRDANTLVLTLIPPLALQVLDLDSLQWSEVPTFGNEPCPRKGSSMVASENGRKMYVFGGSDGVRTMSDVYVLEVERFTWSVVGITGGVPESREGHSAVMVSSFMVVSGGVSLLPDGLKKRISDTWALHLIKCGP